MSALNIFAGLAWAALVGAVALHLGWPPRTAAFGTAGAVIGWFAVDLIRWAVRR